jgi:HEAT repeat protein
MPSIGAANVGDLVGICQDSSRDPKDRALACSLLGWIGTREVIDILLNVAHSAEEAILVWEAIAAVGTIQSKRVTRHLIEVIRSKSSTIKRQASIYALSLLGDERARACLERVLLDPEELPQSRGMAAEALGLLRLRSRTSRALVLMLDNPSAEVRYSCLCALGALRDESALRHIEHLTGDLGSLEGEGTVAERAQLVIHDIREAIERTRESPASASSVTRS